MSTLSPVELVEPSTQIPKMIRGFLVLSCAGGPVSVATVLRHHQQSWFHLELVKICPPLEDTVNPEGLLLNSPTRQMAEAIVTAITAEHAIAPSLVTITALDTLECRWDLRSQSTRLDDFTMLATLGPFRIRFRSLPKTARCLSGNPRHCPGILKQLPRGTRPTGTTHQVPQKSSDLAMNHQPLRPNFALLPPMDTPNRVSPATIDDQLRRALVDACYQKKVKALRALVGFCENPDCDPCDRVL